MRRCTVRGSAAAAVLATLLGSAPSRAGGEEDAPRRPAEARTIPYRLPSPEEASIGVSFVPGSAPPAVAGTAPGSPAERAGLRRGDEVVALDGVEPPDATAAAWMIRVRVPGERVLVEFGREGVPCAVPVPLVPRPGDGALFRGPVFRLAVVPLALQDSPRSPASADTVLDRLFFSVEAHRGPLPSGRRLHGSLRDYFRDQSRGALEVTGRVLPAVRVPAPRRAFADQPMGAGPDSLYARAIRILLAREGDGALDPFDGVAFLYPGPVASAPRRALWPHRASLRAGGRVLPYFVKNVGAEEEPEPIGVLCHEFGHLLGLPDQYGVAHRTGVGDFCLMALGHRGGGESGVDRPFGLCAWCRAALGWLRPAAVDPCAIQDLALGPSTAGRGEAFVVPGEGTSECFLLENRRRAGWDADLPGEGLLVWRVNGPTGEGPFERPCLDLVEAHGIDAPDASMIRPDEVPFPGPRGGALTGETHPGSAGVLRLTAIRTLPGGVVAFRIGDPRPVEAPPPRRVPLPVDSAGHASLRDPVTGLLVRVYAGRPEDAPARDEAEVAPGEPASED